jgi:hypothetical protein
MESCVAQSAKQDGGGGVVNKPRQRLI